jgi:hypothetical protein
LKKLDCVVIASFVVEFGAVEFSQADFLSRLRKMEPKQDTKQPPSLLETKTKIVEEQQLPFTAENIETADIEQLKSWAQPRHVKQNMKKRKIAETLQQVHFSNKHLISQLCRGEEPADDCMTAAFKRQRSQGGLQIELEGEDSKPPEGVFAIFLRSSPQCSLWRPFPKAFPVSYRSSDAWTAKCTLSCSLTRSNWHNEWTGPNPTKRRTKSSWVRKLERMLELL